MYAPDFFIPVASGNVSVASEDASVTSKIILSGNIHRVGATFFNHGAASLHIRFGDDADASLDDFSIKITSGSMYELEKPVYSGEIRGIWDAADGSVKVTEKTRS